ncbi:MAG: hypothetical protein F4Y86_16170 [Gammaproteobacteria bacterium]|nr:hypothetical protein [Gammaproteobacteria bacterium]
MSVALDAFAVMSSHFHLALLHDPKASERWRPETVARRYTVAFPPRSADGVVEQERLAEVTEMLLDDEYRLAKARKILGSLSWFMRHLKQPIARRANREDDCTGHFFEQRFFSGPLRTTEDVVATMCYVDLNPVRGWDRATPRGLRAHVTGAAPPTRDERDRTSCAAGVGPRRRRRAPTPPGNVIRRL